MSVDNIGCDRLSFDSLLQRLVQDEVRKLEAKFEAKIAAQVRPRACVGCVGHIRRHNGGFWRLGLRTFAILNWGLLTTIFSSFVSKVDVRPRLLLVCGCCRVAAVRVTDCEIRIVAVWISMQN